MARLHQQQLPEERSWGRLMCAACAAVAAVVYARTLLYPLVWDDQEIYQTITRLAKTEGLWGLITAEFRLSESPSQYYRPLVFVSIWMDARLAAIGLPTYHLTNIALHVGNTILTFLFLRSFISNASPSIGLAPSVAGTTWRASAKRAPRVRAGTARGSVARGSSARAASTGVPTAHALTEAPLASLVPILLGTLLFAVHPAHVESVAFVSGRVDLMACLFILLAILCLVRRARNGGGRVRWALGAGLSFGAASLCKEIAFFVLPLVALHDFATFRRSSQSRRIDQLVPTLATTTCFLVVLAVRYAIMESTIGVGRWLPYGIVGTVRLLAENLRILLFPWPQSPHTGGDLPDLGARALLALGILAATAVVAARSRGGRPAVIGILWILAFLLPVIGIFSIQGSLVAERFVYVPSIGLSLLVAWGLTRVWMGSVRQRQVVLVSAGVLLVGGALASFVYCSTWKDEVTLYKKMLLRTSDPHYARFNLAAAYQQVGEHEAAVANFRTLLANSSYRRNEALNNLAISLIELERTREAEEVLLGAVGEMPDGLYPLLNLSNLYSEQGRVDEATDVLLRARLVAPNDTRVLKPLVELLKKSGRFDEAAEIVKDHLVKTGPNPDGLNELGVLYARAGRWDEAATSLRQAIRLRPSFPAAQTNLGRVYTSQGSTSKAEAMFTQALQVDPRHTQALVHRAELRHDLGHTEAAVADLNVLETIDPALASKVRTKLGLD